MGEGASPRADSGQVRSFRETAIVAALRDGTAGDLSGPTHEGLDLAGANLRGVDLRHVNLRTADLRGAYCKGVDLRGVDLSEAKLEGASFHLARISGAYFPKNVAAEELMMSLDLGTRIRCR